MTVRGKPYWLAPADIRTRGRRRHNPSVHGIRLVREEKRHARRETPEGTRAREEVEFENRVSAVDLQPQVSDARRAASLALLAQRDMRNPWNGTESRRLEAAVIAFVYSLAAPRVPDLRTGDETAKQLRGALESRSGGDA